MKSAKCLNCYTISETIYRKKIIKWILLSPQKHGESRIKSKCSKTKTVSKWKFDSELCETASFWGPNWDFSHTFSVMEYRFSTLQCAFKRKHSPEIQTLTERFFGRVMIHIKLLQTSMTVKRGRKNAESNYVLL